MIENLEGVQNGDSKGSVCQFFREIWRFANIVSNTTLKKFDEVKSFICIICYVKFQAN